VLSRSSGTTVTEPGSDGCMQLEKTGGSFAASVCGGWWSLLVNLPEVAQCLRFAIFPDAEITLLRALPRGPGVAYDHVNATTWVPVGRVNVGGSDLTPTSIEHRALVAVEVEGVPVHPGGAAAAKLVAGWRKQGPGPAHESSAAEISVVSGAESRWPAAGTIREYRF
jgi:hypothetical protein